MNIKKIGQFALGPFVSAGLGFVSVPIIAWCFPQEEIGRLAILQTCCSFSTLFFTLGLDQAFVREFHEEKDHSMLLKTAITPGLIFISVIIAVSLFFSKELSLLLFGIDDEALVLITSIAILGTFVARFLSLILRMEEKALAFSFCQIGPKLIFTFLVLCYLFFDVKRSFFLLAFANLVSSLLVTIGLGYNTRAIWLAFPEKSIDYQKLSTMLRFGYPLVIGGAGFWGLGAVGKIALITLSSYSELGFYSVGLSFATAIGVANQVFTTIWVPTVYKWVAKGEGMKKIDAVTEHVLCFIVIAFSLVGMFSWSIPYFLPLKYANINYLITACMGQSFLYTISEVTVVGLGISRNTKLEGLAPFVALLVDILCNWLLIPSFGARGAAAGSFLSFYIFFVIRTESAAYVWRNFERKRLYLYLSLVGVIVILTTLFGEAFKTEGPVVWFLLLVYTLIDFRALFSHSWNHFRRLL